MSDNNNASIIIGPPQAELIRMWTPDFYDEPLMYSAKTLRRQTTPVAS